LWHQYGPVCGADGNVEVEVGRQPRRACRTREDHAQDIRMLVVTRERAEAQQVATRLRCEPRVHIRIRASGVPFPTLEPTEGVAQLALQDERIVLGPSSRASAGS